MCEEISAPLLLHVEYVVMPGEECILLPDGAHRLEYETRTLTTPSASLVTLQPFFEVLARVPDRETSFEDECATRERDEMGPVRLPVMLTTTQEVRLVMSTRQLKLVTLAT